MKLRRLAFFWLFPLALMLEGPISAQDQTDRSAGVASDKVINEIDELAAANRRVQELERREVVREAKAELADGAYSRLEIVVGIFGVLITVVVLNLALRTKDAAIAEARVVATSTAKDDAKAAIDLVKAEFEALLTQERSHVAEIEKKLDEVRATVSDIGKLKAKAQKHTEAIQQDADEADQLIARLARESIAGATPKLSDQDREVLETASEAAKDTAQNEWSIEQFRAAISKAQFVDDDQPRIVELSRDMARLHGENVSAFAYAMNAWGGAEQKQGNYNAAITAYEQVIDKIEHSQVLTDLHELDLAMHGMGVACLELGQAERAEALFLKGLDIAVQVDGHEAPGTLATRHALARSILDQGRAPEAEAAFRELLPVKEKVDGPDASDTLATRHELARAIVEQGRGVEAEAAFRELLALREKFDGPEASYTLITTHEVANAILAQGRAAEAEIALRELLTLKEKVDGPEASGTAVTRYCFALACHENGNSAEARKILDSIPDLLERSDWPVRHAACLAYVRGKVADGLGLIDEATTHLTEARRLYEENFPEDYHPRRQLEAYIELRGGTES